MTSSPSAAGQPPSPGSAGRPAGGPVDGPRRAYRATEGRMIGGVASGVAAHLGVRVLPVRAVFLVTTALGGFGALLYAGLWMFLPTRPRRLDPAPGIAAATRQDKRRGPDTWSRRLADNGPLVAIAAIGVGLLAMVSAITGHLLVTGPLVLAIGGVGVLWWQADEAQRERWRDQTSRGPLAGVFGAGPWSFLRVLVGLVMLVAAIVLFTVRSGNLSSVVQVASAAALGVVGVGFMAGPSLIRLSADLREEREARVRSEERADVAAHLHDSVLQTLALIQKSAHDAATVSRLARAQERDLRSWLYDDAPGDVATVAAALRAAAAEAEDAHGVPVEVVAVGDHPTDDVVRPLVLAAREAIFNAVRHSGAARVDVYAESTPQAYEVFVRDRGAGFRPDDVPADRHGVRDSVVGRMERHGGTAQVRSTPGEGTEVRLLMPLSQG